MSIWIQALEFIFCISIGAIVMFAWTYRYSLDLEATNRAQQRRLRAYELVEIDRERAAGGRVRKSSRG